MKKMIIILKYVIILLALIRFLIFPVILSLVNYYQFKFHIFNLINLN